MASEVVIESRFRGPAESGNGGYSCGVLARFLEPRPAEVTLRLPPPLDRPMRVEVTEGESATMSDGEAVVGEAHAVDELSLELPGAISVEGAAAACAASPLQHDHPYPTCFVCSPERRQGDGLRVTCGPIDGKLVAAPWQVDGSVADAGGEVPPEIVWSVLDCPGGISAMLLPDVGLCVLGRLAARIDSTIEAGTTCVAIGWPIDRDGRKIQAGSAILSDTGEVLGQARATWIELKS
jgi:hypothetical protein